MGNHLFVIFAVLDVSFAFNSCINHSFFTFITYTAYAKRAVIDLSAVSVAAVHKESSSFARLLRTSGDVA